MKPKHVHKYVRVKMKGGEYIVYKCVLPGCTHFINRDLVVGHETLCWKCGTTIVMTMKLATLRKPHCVDCTRPATGKAAQWNSMEQI